MLGHWPAACQGEPEVSSLFSINKVSEQPSRARWYNRLAPMMPPPTTTMRAFVFMDTGWEVVGHNKLIHRAPQLSILGALALKYWCLPQRRSNRHEHRPACHGPAKSRVAPVLRGRGAHLQFRCGCHGAAAVVRGDQLSDSRARGAPGLLAVRATTAGRQAHGHGCGL